MMILQTFQSLEMIRVANSKLMMHGPCEFEGSICVVLGAIKHVVEELVPLMPCV